MAFTRGEIKADVLTLLNKTSKAKGFYTDDKLNMALREAMTFIAMEAFDAGEGWQNKIRFLPMPTGAYSVPIPPDISYIDQVRVKIGDTYVPLAYDQQREAVQWAPGSGTQAYPNTYRIIDNQIFVNPPLSAGSDNALWIEGTTYPKRVANDSDQIEGQFDQCMLWFMIYRIASFCASSVGKADPEWARQESQFYNKLIQMLNKRDNSNRYIQNFMG